MKAGIITIHNSPNYGACLQSFALWKYITGQGVDCEIIDLYRPYQKEYIPGRKFVPMLKTETYITGYHKTCHKETDWEKQGTEIFFRQCKGKV